MLLQAMIKKMEKDFPTIEFAVNEKDHLISIPAKHGDVGTIDIQDDFDELTVFVGNFTHWHVGCYEENLTEEQKAESVAEDVSEFLQDLFSDKIIMWGCHQKGGGFYLKGERPNSQSWLGAQHKEWVWSGPLHS